MNKKLMTMLVACALSVSALSTTAVFAEDAVVTGETPAVTETTTNLQLMNQKSLYLHLNGQGIVILSLK